ncbi:MAG: 3,4-dehydroadipyl-CoA semialdehyde dehydrogenase, partial [Gammaproteobacteria bacterium]
LHINAFNFPCWGMLEKLGPTLLAGVPAIVKPASSTAYLTAKVFEAIIESNILPDGAVQLICGSTGDLMDHLNCQDVVAFTGSKNTADHLRQHRNIIAQSVRFTAETDSLNASILGPDAKPGTPEFDLYVKEIVREMTVKAGQKCTAIRRIIAPESLVVDLADALSARLAKIKLGHPALEETGMGTLASLDQRKEVRMRVEELSAENEIVFGDLEKFEVIGADKERGAFFAPILLQCKNPLSAESVHSIEAFGPVSTIIPYSSIENAVALANRGEGSLVGSVFTYDNETSKHLALGIAPYHGRVLLMNRDCAKESTGHGSPLPHLVHGGPGRAGGGEELGGIRGVLHYMQRIAVQGSPAAVETLA